MKSLQVLYYVHIHNADKNGKSRCWDNGIGGSSPRARTTSKTKAIAQRIKQKQNQSQNVIKTGPHEKPTNPRVINKAWNLALSGKGWHSLSFDALITPP